MQSEIQIGSRVRIQLGETFGEKAGWYEGVVVRIEPYSQHRSFYWVELNATAQEILKVKEISIFNPKRLQKMDG
ncbi:MAG: hypothetical protein IT310_09370 [Anaerolineales bacterium]|nr:hypothetical protein [Anaerolineales bacterium]